MPNYTEGLYEGREPVTFMEKYTVEFRDTFMRNLAKFRAEAGPDPFGNCVECGGGEEGSISHTPTCVVEGPNPRIFCGESIPSKNEIKLDNAPTV